MEVKYFDMVEKKVKVRLNEICTDEQYIAQGFTVEEVPMIRRHDELFNKSVTDSLTSEEEEEMYNLIETLGI